jgi:hypothetical protein
MTVDPANLLKMLGLTGRAGRLGAAPLTPTGAAPGAQSIEPGQFADLLNKARRGELSSNKPVTIAPEAAGKVKLSDDQLARIALAADKAEAAGIRKALVVLDDQQVLLDVANRTVSGAPAGSDASVIPGVDGVINLSKNATPSTPSASIPPPAGATSSLSLARLLADRDNAAAA